VKKRLAFIDHNFHQKSRSADFLRDVLKDYFIIDNFWWSLKDEYKLISLVKDYDNFFFFQSLLPLDDMLLLRNKNVMWAPMYDNLSQKNNYWKKINYLGIKILSFSSPVKKLVTKYNCNHLILKYAFKDIKLKIIPKKKISIFFWYRNNIKFYDWIKNFNSKIIRSVIFFNCPDPGKKHDEIKSEDIKKYNIKVIKKSFLPKKEYLNLIKKCEVFVSPRKQEGIGMSFLEAMSMGKYIVSNNDATMSDYITNNKIGHLFSKDNKKEINIKNILKYNKYRNKIAIKMYENWLLNKKKIIKLFLKKRHETKKNIFKEILFVSDYLIRLKIFLKKLII
jgi:glycosyltransferase involved in cell wall biosynthesis